MAVHRYWRVKTAALPASGSPYTSWSEVQFRDTFSGPDLTNVTGVAIRDSYYAPEGLVAQNAFDDNNATKWASNGTGTNAYIGWDFDTGNEKDIIQFGLRIRSDISGVDQAPTQVYLQYSDDGSSWTTFLDRSMTWTSLGQTQVFSSDGLGDMQRALQLGVYALASQPAEFLYDLQSGVYVTAAAETSNTFHDINAFQLGAYALVRGLADRRDLRAWTFTQDDHDFYVLQLGDESTYVFDKLTSQWAKWVSPDFVYWRGQDGCDWEGFNLACDTENGKLWEIDPTGRLDYTDTPIRSQVTGQLTERFRNHLNCYMAELAISEAEPPTGVDASTLGITLRTYDSNGLNSVDHGEVTGEAIGDDITVRWYGLGLMQAPGRVFEITDTGYARRVEGLNLETGNNDPN